MQKFLTIIVKAIAVELCNYVNFLNQHYFKNSLANNYLSHTLTSSFITLNLLGKWQSNQEKEKTLELHSGNFCVHRAVVAM